jgi:hypothetical protein
MLRVAVEERVLDVGERGAVVHEAVDGLAVADGADDLFEEVVFAADDVDVGVLEGFADEVGVGLGDVFLDVDFGEFDVAFFGEAELELLVVLAGVVEEFHRGGLLLDGLRLGEAAGLDAGGGGEFAVLDAGGLGLGLAFGDLGLHVALGLGDLASARPTSCVAEASSLRALALAMVTLASARPGAASRAAMPSASCSMA